MFYSLSPPSLFLSTMAPLVCSSILLHPLLSSTLVPPIALPTFCCGSSHFLLYCCPDQCSKSVSSLHTITSESTQCTCSHSTTNLAGTNHPDRNERARSLGAEQRFQVTRNGNGNGTQTQTQTKPSPKGSPKMQQRSRRGSWLFGRKQQQR